MVRMLGPIAVTVLAAVALLLVVTGSRDGRSASASNLGDITWTVVVDPPQPHVGDTVTVTFHPSAQPLLSPLFSASATVIQPNPPVVTVQSAAVSGGYGGVVTLQAIGSGQAQLTFHTSFEKWKCSASLDPTPPAPTPVPTACYSNIVPMAAPDAAITVPFEPTPTATPAPTSGDVNCDGYLSSVDAALVLQHAARLVQSLACLLLGDMNRDCAVNAIDSAIMLQVLAHLTPAEPYQNC